MTGVNPIMIQSKANYEFAMQALECNKQLRATVTNVFKFLCNSNISEDKSGEESGASTSEPTPQRSSTFLQNFQELLSAVNKDFNEVEKNTNSITPTYDVIINLPMSWLSLDSTSDKLYRYRDTVQIQQWFRRLNEYCNSTMQCLHKALGEKPRQTFIGSRHAGRSRKVPIIKYLQLTTENLVCSHIKNIFSQITRQPHSHTAEVLHQAGCHRFVKLTIGKTCAAYIILWSLNVEKVFVKGLDESITDGDEEWDLETPSQISLYRKISNLATAAMHQYAINRSPGQAEYQFLLLVRFLVSYRTLFADQCTFCKKIMKDGLPAYLRDFYRLQETCHETCQPK